MQSPNLRPIHGGAAGTLAASPTASTAIAVPIAATKARLWVDQPCRVALGPNATPVTITATNMGYLNATADVTVDVMNSGSPTPDTHLHLAADGAAAVAYRITWS